MIAVHGPKRQIIRYRLGNQARHLVSPDIRAPIYLQRGCSQDLRGC
ncbi:hypothetical protein J5W49_13310 [Candidatus Akkermansia timonensis]|nr:MULTISPECIES: hypothetical protein [Akkermansia]MBS7153423.1 hypothetical protein [Akkermansia sp.]QWO91238.1 hypothetical protein J5W64_02185 [Candidatus Akkermansia timonensis]QWO95980.1 hypothetical protein J5W49_13310 [Candidatus Akkermansia timonensis]